MHYIVTAVEIFKVMTKKLNKPRLCVSIVQYGSCNFHNLGNIQYTYFDIYVCQWRCHITIKIVQFRQLSVLVVQRTANLNVKGNQQSCMVSKLFTRVSCIMVFSALNERNTNQNSVLVGIRQLCVYALLQTLHIILY